jgi:hypothetical protein
MKKLLLFLCTAFIACSSCTKNAQKSNHTTVAITQIYDVTDSLLLRPTPAPIYALCDFQSDIDRAVTVKSVLITDKMLNPSSSTSLEDGDISKQKNVKGVAHFRKLGVRWFNKSIQSLITDFPKEYAGGKSLEYSECYATIAGELEQIMTISHSRKAVLVYSDLMEHNDLFNFYDKSTQRLLVSNPDIVVQKLLKKRPLLDDLRGCRVYLLFRPKNKSEDTLFQSIVKVYVKLLEIRGARVIVQADVNGINW